MPWDKLAIVSGYCATTVLEVVNKCNINIIFHYKITIKVGFWNWPLSWVYLPNTHSYWATATKDLF